MMTRGGHRSKTCQKRSSRCAASWACTPTWMMASWAACGIHRQQVRPRVGGVVGVLTWPAPVLLPGGSSRLLPGLRSRLWGCRQLCTHPPQPTR